MKFYEGTLYSLLKCAARVITGLRLNAQLLKNAATTLPRAHWLFGMSIC